MLPLFFFFFFVFVDDERCYTATTNKYFPRVVEQATARQSIKFNSFLNSCAQLTVAVVAASHSFHLAKSNFFLYTYAWKCTENHFAARYDGHERAIHSRSQQILKLTSCSCCLMRILRLCSIVFFVCGDFICIFPKSPLWQYLNHKMTRQKISFRGKLFIIAKFFHSGNFCGF